MYVGVILQQVDSGQRQCGIPHVCGGDPADTLKDLGDYTYSPCMWG